MEAFFAGIRILVVEDNRMNRDIVERQLRRIGCEHITSVTNGQEALEWLRKYRCDVIFTDCQMPVMDGYEMAMRIRAAEHGRQSRVCIIALSASAMEEDIARCFAVGMDTHVAKPTQMAGIRAALEKAAAMSAGFTQ